MVQQKCTETTSLRENQENKIAKQDNDKKSFKNIHQQ